MQKIDFAVRDVGKCTLSGPVEKLRLYVAALRREGQFSEQRLLRQNSQRWGREPMQNESISALFLACFTVAESAP
jgi:hypothetical protein